MKMKLNAQHEMYVPYERYPGKYLEALACLRTGGRVPLSISGSMKRICEVANESFPKEVREEWFSTCIYTDDGVASIPDGRIKLVRNAFSESTVSGIVDHGALSLSSQAWDALSGSEVMELSKGRVKELEKKGYCTEDAMKIEELRFLAEDSLPLYLNLLSSLNPNASIWHNLSSHRSSSPCLRPLVVNNLYNVKNNGSLIAHGDLNNKACILVGEAKKNGNGSNGTYQLTREQLLELVKGKMSGSKLKEYERGLDRLLQH